MIIDFNKSHVVKTGITAGKGQGQVESSGEIYPGVDFTLSSTGINDLIERFNGFGWVKIGKVTPDFYMTLQAMEDEGILKVRSTPKLSTINGHQAKMSIGNKEYYLEKESNLMGTQNPQLATRERYRSVEAELKVEIRPVISGDNQITMNINVNQSDFTERINETAPPGQVTRAFQSTIRIKNQEMVLLGGLEEKRVNSSGKGIPLLTRIPILKWIFSNRNDQRSNGKLNIFIKPTIIN
jgi:type IV pilus assembly protein PilQ